MGFELGYALYRRRPLAPEEHDRLDQHIRVWRARIIGYDWHVLRDPRLAPNTELIAWGTLRPTRGQPGLSDQGGHIPEIIAHLHAAVLNARDLIRDSRLALADAVGALAWNGSTFEYSELAERPALPIGNPIWTSLSELRSIPDGRPSDLNMDRRKRPTTRGAASVFVQNADVPTLISLVLAPASGKVSDLERTAAVERLGESADPAATAALVHRARLDATEKKWTAGLLRGLANGRGRCHWSTALLAFNSGWRGAAETLVASVDESAIPHLERLPIARLWSSLALLGFDAIGTPAAQEAEQRLLARVTEPLPATRLATVDAIMAAHRAKGPDLIAALQNVASCLQAYAARGGDSQTWLAHHREAGQRALAVLTGEQVPESEIAVGLAALAEFAVTGRDPVRLDEFQRIDLLTLESEWLAAHGISAP